MSDKPQPPSEELTQAFLEWEARWRSALGEGEEKGWLEYEGYDGPPSSISPTEIYQKDLSRWEHDNWARERREAEQARVALEAKAEKAAKDARERVLREGLK